MNEWSWLHNIKQYQSTYQNQLQQSQFGYFIDSIRFRLIIKFSELHLHFIASNLCLCVMYETSKIYEDE